MNRLGLAPRGSFHNAASKRVLEGLRQRAYRGSDVGLLDLAIAGGFVVTRLAQSK
jgi:hypothetical protein